MISQALIDRMLAEAVKGPLYVSLHTEDPQGTGYAELSEYRRAEASGAFSSNAGGVVVNAREIAVENLPAATVTHAAVWDAPTGGNLLFSGQLAEARKQFKGDSLKIKPGMFGIRLEA